MGIPEDIAKLTKDVADNKFKIATVEASFAVALQEANLEIKKLQDELKARPDFTRRDLFAAFAMNGALASYTKVTGYRDAVIEAKLWRCAGDALMMEVDKPSWAPGEKDVPKESLITPPERTDK